MKRLQTKNLILSSLILSLLLIPYCFVFFGTPGIYKFPESVIPKTSASEITLIIPENKSYGVKTGYFLSSYDFENVSDFTDSYGVIEELEGHKNILKIKYGNGMSIENQFTRIDGSIEFYFKTEDATDRTVFSFEGDDTLPHIYFYVVNDNWYYLERDVVDPQIVDLTDNYKPLDNVWHHIRIDFDCSGGGGYLGLSPESWRVTVDGYSSSELKILRSSGSPPPCVLKKIYLFSEVEQPEGGSYFDAFGYSWDIFYSIGENLNEGLPILFEISTPLDWIAYSLDGQSNIEIPGNTSVTMPNNGSHSIKVVGNYLAGPIYESTLRYFVVSPIEILTPNKDSIWEEDSTHEITWISSVNISHVDIEIYKGDILKYSHYGLENNGSYEWFIPEGVNIGNDWKVKIIDSSDPLIFGVSEFFELVSSIVILTPDSSSVWYTGRRYDITWSTTGNITHVDIQFYKDSSLQSSVNGIANNQSYRWFVNYSVIPSNNWTIKLIDSNNASIFDISDPFEISNTKTLSILNPVSSSSWERGTEQYIRWFYTGNVSDVDIVFFRDGAPVYTINGTENDGAYFWKISLSEIASTSWRIKITASNNYSIYTWSDFFEVYERPELLISTPDKFARILANTSQLITWSLSTGSNVTHVTLEVYKGPDLMYNLGSIESSSNYLWNIPFDPPPGSNWRIRISDTYVPSIYTLGDLFEIYTYKSMNILTPTPLSSWSIKGDHYINWTWTDEIPYVDIEISKGIDLIHQVTNLENNGSYYFHMNYDEEPGTDWKVRVSASDYHAIYDEIPSFNAHIKRTVTVTAPSTNTILYQSDYYDIVWTTNGSISEVKIDLFEEGDYIQTISDRTPNDGRFLWHIISGVDLSNFYQIKISDADDPSVYSFSKAYFKLEQQEFPTFGLLIIIGIGAVSIPSAYVVRRRLKKRKRRE